MRFGLRIDDMTLGYVSLAIREGSYDVRVRRVGTMRGVVH